MFFRMLFGLPGAAIVTALLFLVMGWMIRQEPTIGKVPPTIDSIVPKLKDDSERPPKTPPTTKPTQPDAPKIKFEKTTENPGGIKIDEIPGPVIDRGGGISVDPGGTMPTIRIPPAYPENCRARGAQGVVMVEFDVTADGAVVNPRVIASENSCLDRAALTTISKWKYQPQTDSSGRPIPQRGLRQSFNFQLTEG